MVSRQDKKLERRVGMSKGDHKHASLHSNVGKPPTKPTERESTVDWESEVKIFGPPESDEEPLEQEDKPSAPVSPPPQLKSSNARFRPLKANGLNARSSSHQSSSPPTELSNPASSIPATLFYFSNRQTCPKKRNSNMMSGDMSDDELFTTPKKLKKTYRRQSTMPDTSPKTEKMKKGKIKVNGSSPAGKKRGPEFRTFDTQPLISQVNEMEEREEKNEATKVLLQSGLSPRAQRASNRSRNTPKKTKKDILNGFKIPEQIPSPKSTSTSEDAPQKFIMPLILPDTSPIPRATRGNKTFKKPDTIITTNMKSLLETAQNRLNLPDVHALPPTSSITASSLPSTFNDAASYYSLSSAPSSPEIDASIQGLLFEKTNIPYFREPPTRAKCPICKERVERDFLEDFERGGTLNIRQQLRFCKAHRARTAILEWKARGYPEIDWQHFDKRLAHFHRELDDILQGKKPSFYRNAFEDHLRSGRNRTLQQTMMSGSSMEGLIPGYYGSRGAKVMMENIMIHFAPKLRKLAASDKVLSSGGVSSYVQAVLAPELAVMLVMQDMGTDEEGARTVLRDSVDIGNLLNEEEDDVIKDPEPREEVEV